MRALAIMAWLLPLVGGCSEELGRMTFSGPGEAECTLHLDGPDAVIFRADLEVEGPESLADARGDYRYEIDLWRGKTTVASTHCDALDVGFSLVRSRTSSKTRIGRHRHSFKEARVLDCSVELPSGTESKLSVELVKVRDSDADIINAVLIPMR